MRYIWFVVLVTACLLANAYFSHAHSQPLGVQPASVAGVAGTTVQVGWPEIVGLALLLAAYAARRFAPAQHWAHSQSALWVISLGAGALEAAAKAVQAGGFNLQQVLYSVLTALLAMLVMANPSMTAQGNAVADKS